MFDFNSFPFKLSGKTVDYICPKCKYKFEAPIEAVLQFEQEDEWNDCRLLYHPIQFVLNVILINAFLLIINPLVDSIINILKNNHYNSIMSKKRD